MGSENLGRLRVQRSRQGRIHGSWSRGHELRHPAFGRYWPTLSRRRQGRARRRVGSDDRPSAMHIPHDRSRVGVQRHAEEEDQAGDAYRRGTTCSARGGYRIRDNTRKCADRADCHREPDWRPVFSVARTGSVHSAIRIRRRRIEEDVPMAQESSASFPDCACPPRLALSADCRSYSLRWGNQTDSGQNKEPPSDDRWKIRSTTWLGWADAMASQWGDLK
jgi:hypothetical protein